MGYVLNRVCKVFLITVADTFIDYTKDPKELKDFHFAYIDKRDFKKEHYKNLMKKLRTAIKQNTPVNFVFERRPGLRNKKQKIDYVIEAEFW